MDAAKVAGSFFPAPSKRRRCRHDTLPCASPPVRVRGGFSLANVTRGRQLHIFLSAQVLKLKQTAVGPNIPPHQENHVALHTKQQVVAPRSVRESGRVRDMLCSWLFGQHECFIHRHEAWLSKTHVPSTDEHEDQLSVNVFHFPTRSDHGPTCVKRPDADVNERRLR